MAVAVGDIVRFKDTGPKGEVGRICKDNGVSACINFKSTGCLRARKDDLEVTTGSAPECGADCKNGC